MTRLLIHPVVLFPVLIAILAVFEGPLRFLPYGDDTYSNWLIHAKRLWLADSYHADNLVSGAVGYAPGWHLLMAFSSPVWGDFSDTRVLGLSTAAHIAMLGLIFDITVIWLNRVNGVTSVAAQSAGGLTVILLALAAEASWQLVPTLILPEMPLFYTLIGSFASCLLFGIKGCRRLRLSFFVSLSLCCHFLIKSQGFAALPAIVVIGFLFNSGRFDYRNTGRNLVHVAILTGPAIGALLAWKALGPDSSECVANLGEIFSSASAQIDGGSHWATLLTDVLVTSGNHVLTYKFPLVLIAGSGILLGLFDPKLRPVGLLVLLYTAVYLLAVFWMYLSCPHSFGVYMSSILRYLQLPVRVIHTLGLLMLFFMTLRLVLSRFASDIVVFMNRAFLVTALVAGAYQVTQVKASFFEINHPTAEKRIQTIPSDVEAVLTTTQKQGLHYPRVLMVYTFWELLPFLVALHNGLPTSRDELPGNGELSRWNLEHVRFQNIDAPAPAGGEVLSPEFFYPFRRYLGDG